MTGVIDHSVDKLTILWLLYLRFFFFFFLMFEEIIQTRTHCSSRLLGGVCLEGVCVSA